MPLIVEDLQDSKVFLRWKEAIEFGVNRGLGIPYSLPSRQTWVVTFLSALKTPFARRFEIWVPNERQSTLYFHSGVCDQNRELTIEHHSDQISKNSGVIGEAWASRLPTVSANLSGENSAARASAVSAGLYAMVALPFIHDGELKAVVALYF